MDEAFYCRVGRFVVEFAALEERIDEFVIRFATEKEQVWSLLAKEEFGFTGSKSIDLRKPPRNMWQKIAFVVTAAVYFPRLREIGDEDGLCDLNVIGYVIEELNESRNVIVHGSAYQFNPGCNGISVAVRKWKSIGNVYEPQEFVYSIEYLDYLLECLDHIKSVIAAFLSVLDGCDLRSRFDEVQKGRAKERDFLRILHEQDVCT